MSFLRRHHMAILWLTAVVLVAGPVRAAGPGVGLDSGWAAGLNLARQADLRFGRDLVFTYGPWGFLDVPLVISRPDFVLGLCFSMGSVAAAWLVTFAALQPKVRPRGALLAASVLTLTFSSVSAPSFLLTAAAVVACVRHLRQVPTLSTAWCPVVVAGLGALLLQLKFSEGLAVSMFAFVTSVASPRARLTRTVGAGVSWLVTSFALWVLAGQSLSDVGPWVRASISFVAGYATALSDDSFDLRATIVLYLVALLLFAYVLALARKRTADGAIISHAGSLVVIVGALLFGFKQTFTRQSPAHNAAYFVIVALLLCLLLERGPTLRPTLMAIVVASLVASPGLSTVIRGNPTETWASAWQTLTSDASRVTALRRARVEDQAVFGVPGRMAEAARGHPVSVDPWEVSLAWAYSMRWRPMPVFQSYAAFTGYLDTLNADAARLASDDQMIIRTTTESSLRRLTLIDGRNPMWESPRYMLTVVCNYSLVTADKRWMLLRKGANRCGKLPTTTLARQVSADELIRVPGAAVDEIVVASFVPAKVNPLLSLPRVLFKEPQPLVARLDNTLFRLPEGLASGPLLTVLPKALGWPAQFREDTSARSIAFSRPGEVQFRTIRLTR